MFFALAFIVLLVLVAGAITGGAAHATRLAWVAAMLAPEWLSRNVGSLTIDMRLVTLLMLIPIALLGDRLPKRLTLVDFLVAALSLVGILSLNKSGLLVPSEVMAILATWIVPYLMGRVVISSISDMEKLIPYACGVCLFLATWSAVESVTHVNPINVIAARGGSRISEQNLRMGLRRAEGPLGHPIYFGMSLAMLFPWTIEAARRSINGQLPRFLVALPFVCAVGVFCTVSRGPLLVLVATLGCAVYFWRPELRLPLTVAAVVCLGLIMIAWPIVVDELQAFSGESPDHTVTINGVEYEYSGTKHRTLLYSVYEDAMIDAGMLGHGKWGAHIQHQKYIEPHLRRTFRSIDNHYVLLILNWGVAGLVAFLALGLTGVASGLHLALVGDADSRVLLGSLVASIALVMLMLLTVWFSSGFGFAWLCGLGMISSCRENFALRRARNSILRVPSDRAEYLSRSSMVAAREMDLAMIHYGPGNE